MLRGFLPWKIPLTRFSRVTSKRGTHLVASSHRREYTFVCIRRYTLMPSFYLTARKKGVFKRGTQTCVPYEGLALHHPEPVFGRNSTPPLRGGRLEQSTLCGIRLRRMVLGLLDEVSLWFHVATNSWLEIFEILLTLSFYTECQVNTITVHIIRYRIFLEAEGRGVTI